MEKRNEKIIITVAVASVIVAGCSLYFFMDGEETQWQSGIGWGLVSLPETVNKTDVFVLHNQSYYTWSEAVNENIILNFVYGWNAENQYYEITETFEKFQGYWAYFYKENVSLIADIDVLYCGKIYYNGTENLTCSKLIISPEYNNTIICNSMTVDEVHFIFHDVGVMER